MGVRTSSLALAVQHVRDLMEGYGPREILDAGVMVAGAGAGRPVMRLEVSFRRVSW